MPVEEKVSTRLSISLRPQRLSLIAALAAALALTAASPAAALADAPAKGPASQLSLPQPAPGAENRSSAAPANPAVAATAPAPATPPLAVRGGDNALWVQHAGAWSSYGGVLSGNPAVVVVPSDTADGAAETLYIVTGSDHALWVRSDTQPWQHLAPFYTYAVQGPSAVVTGTAGAYTLTVGIEGSDGALWVDTAPVNAAQLPSLNTNASWGGRLQGAPAAVVEAGIPTFYVTGVDGNAWWRQGGTAWQQFSTLHCFGHPAAGTAAGGYEMVSCWGFDNALWFVSNSGSGWTQPQSAGGILVEDLAVRGLSSDVTVDVGGLNNTIWELSIAPAGISSWQQVPGAIIPSDQPAYLVPRIPVYSQVYRLDCETAAMQMALAGLGHWYSQSSLLRLEQPDYRHGYWQGNGILRWGNPYLRFVGDPNGSETAYTGWGVFYPVIVSIARTHGTPNTYGGEQLSAGSIYAALAAGHPVQAWVEYGWVRPRMGSWLTFDGSRWIRYSTWEHSVTLVGVSATGVLVNDPGRGRRYWVSRGTFETSWGDYNNMAVVFI